MTTETAETETSEAMEASEATGMSELRAVVQRVEALERRLGIEQALPKNRAAEVEKLVLRDQSGKVRAWLGLLADGSPGLMLTDREGKGGIALSAAADGSTAMGFYDTEGRARAELGMESHSTRLTLWDQAGQVIVRLPPASSGPAGEEVRIAVEGVPTEGNPLFSRILQTVEAWVARGRLQTISGFLAEARAVRAELRERAERTIRDLDARRTRSLATLAEPVTRVMDTVMRRLDVTWADEVAALRGRIVELEQRLETLARERAA